MACILRVLPHHRLTAAAPPLVELAPRHAVVVALALASLLCLAPLPAGGAGVDATGGGGGEGGKGDLRAVVRLPRSLARSVLFLDDNGAACIEVYLE